MSAGQSSSRPVKGKPRMMASAVGIKGHIGLSQRFERELEPHLNLDQGSTVARDRVEKYVEQLARLEVVGMQPFETGRPLIGVCVGIGLQDPQACAVASIAVPGSLTAGDSARDAISERTIRPKRGS